MSEKTSKQDRRTRYTRQSIKETFLELLKQKNFTKITVTEICKISEINRGTFYLHYRDIYDLSEQMENEIILKFEELLNALPHVPNIFRIKLFFFHPCSLPYKYKNIVKKARRTAAQKG